MEWARGRVVLVWRTLPARAWGIVLFVIVDLMTDAAANPDSDLSVAELREFDYGYFGFGAQGRALLELDAWVLDSRNAPVAAGGDEEELELRLRTPLEVVLNGLAPDGFSAVVSTDFVGLFLDCCRAGDVAGAGEVLAAALKSGGVEAAMRCLAAEDLAGNGRNGLMLLAMNCAAGGSAERSLVRLLRVLQRAGLLRRIVNRRCFAGKTLLHYAAEAGLFRVCSQLVRAGAHPALRDGFERTPQEAALRAGRGADLAMLLCRMTVRSGVVLFADRVRALHSAPRPLAGADAALRRGVADLLRREGAGEERDSALLAGRERGGRVRQRRA